MPVHHICLCDYDEITIIEKMVLVNGFLETRNNLPNTVVQLDIVQTEAIMTIISCTASDITSPSDGQAGRGSLIN